MKHVPHLKKVLVGAAFAGAFFLGAPTAGAQEAPNPAAGLAGLIDQVRGDLAALGIQTPPPDPALVSAAEGALQSAAAPAGAGAPAGEAQGAVAEAPGAQAGQQYAVPATNPNPIGLLEQLTQPDFKSLGIDPNYQWKNDGFSKVAAGKPGADFVLHRVPGSFFDAPRIPDEATAALNRGHSLYGPGTPLYVGPQMMCTLTAAGTDEAGRKVGLTAGHCGNVGDAVVSADSWQVGPTGTIADKNQALDYSVIELGSNAEVTRTYNGMTATQLGGGVRPGEVACKNGVATGTTCGMALVNVDSLQISQICAMEGDSGAPLYIGGRIVGSISGGLVPGAACHTPLQGPLHSPTMATSTDAILADLSRRGVVGAGMTLPEA